MKITLEPKKVAAFFLSVVLLLTLMHVAGRFSAHLFGHEYIFGLIPLFNLGIEGNIPALYSSIAILFCSILLSIITFSKRKSGDSYYFYWLGLAIIFLILSIDESVSLHESLDQPVHEALHTTGLLYFAWVIPCGIAVVVFAAIYFKFLINLPKKTRNLFIFSGAMYVIGALGFEMLEGLQAYVNGKQNIIYTLIYTIEELLEMLAIVLFIYALLSYINLELKGLSINLSPGTKE